ncbi:TPA: DUF1697 domain-containing protein [Candidatus Saccharibacteria bacterium]|nr:DUF1697 domain-containing protein [Candidatus Saccharibacteria bacterium]HRJ91099.1 DUF1697 domain-containing protein [Candidatus Saccharibacteria bacterium]
MKYACLLRAINVGGNRRVEMQRLKKVFEAYGATNVVTYINSGNVVFESAKAPSSVDVQQMLKDEFGFDIPVLLLSAKQIRDIAEAVPKEWQNDREQAKSDVLYLFSDADKPEIVKQIGYRPEFETVLYVPGALLSHVKRANQGRSCLLKLMGTPLYKQMTIRNVNTARKLAELCAE